MREIRINILVNNIFVDWKRNKMNGIKEEDKKEICKELRILNN